MFWNIPGQLCRFILRNLHHCLALDIQSLEMLFLLMGDSLGARITELRKGLAKLREHCLLDWNACV
jgi:hypothetical protein